MARTPDPKRHALLARSHSPPRGQRFDSCSVLRPGMHRQVEVLRLEAPIPA